MKFDWKCQSCSAVGEISADKVRDAVMGAGIKHLDDAPNCPGGVVVSQSRTVQSPAAPTAHDPVHSPRHYTSHPSGVECIDVAEHYGFAIGNCIKYLWRAGLKGDAIEDLEKASWYLRREIERRKKEARS